MLVVALLLGCSFGPRPWPPAGQIWVPTARVEIPVGALLSRRDLEWVSLPDEFVARTVVRRDADLDGMSASGRLLVGEFIRSERLVSSGDATDDAVSAPFAPASVAEVLDVERVTVFRGDLPAGRVVFPENLFAISIQRPYLPPNLFPDPARVIGQTLCEPVFANELVRTERFLDPATGDCRVAP